MKQDYWSSLPASLRRRIKEPDREVASSDNGQSSGVCETQLGEEHSDTQDANFKDGDLDAAHGCESLKDLPAGLQSPLDNGGERLSKATQAPNEASTVLKIVERVVFGEGSHRSCAGSASSKACLPVSQSCTGTWESSASTALPSLQIINDFLDAASVLAARNEAAALLGSAKLSTELSIGATGQIRSKSGRSDTAVFLKPQKQPEDGQTALEVVIEAMLALREELLAAGFDVRGPPSFQLARFAADTAGFLRHRDRSFRSPGREMTATCYLNPAWSPRDAGELRLFGDVNSDSTGVLKVEPIGGRLVLFNSGVEHEVLPTYADRYALTAWFYSSNASECSTQSSTAPLLTPGQGRETTAGWAQSRGSGGENSEGHWNELGSSRLLSEEPEEAGDSRKIADRVESEASAAGPPREGTAAGEAAVGETDLVVALRQALTPAMAGSGPSLQGLLRHADASKNGFPSAGLQLIHRLLQSSPVARPAAAGSPQIRHNADSSDSGTPAAPEVRQNLDDTAEREGPFLRWSPMERPAERRREGQEAASSQTPHHLERVSLRSEDERAAGLPEDAAARIGAKCEADLTDGAFIIRRSAAQEPTHDSLAARRQEGQQLAEGGSAADLIFVSIAAYRDPETQWTLRDLFLKAKHPERLRIGVVWQIDAVQDASFVCLAGDQRWLKQVREVRIDWREATGPCKARALAQGLWRGEEFVLQIDSHMRFAHGWDDQLVYWLLLAERSSGRGRAVLSTYPPPYQGDGSAAELPADIRSTALCADRFDAEGMLRLKGRRLRAGHPAPLRSLFWAAGYSFSRSRFLLEVPYDDSLPFLFFGEEASMLVRMWTRGFDPWTPPEAVAFHLWSRAYRHTLQKDIPADLELKRLSQAKVRQLFESRVSAAAEAAMESSWQPSTPEAFAAARDGCCSAKEEGPGGSQRQSHPCNPRQWRLPAAAFELGSERSLEAFFEFCGVDFISLGISEAAQSGGLEPDAFA